MNKIRKYDLEIVVFICGAVVMIFELVGSRIIAPYVGASTYVWTSVIGVVLGSLSAGYYYGGRFADSNPHIKPLALIILFSSFAILFSTLIKDIVSSLISIFPLSTEFKSVLIAVILFAPASFLLGMVSPFALRLRMKDIGQAGGTSGNLYAMSTLGSIVGTFLAGFYLIPNFGSFSSLILLVVILVLVAVFLLGKDILNFLNNFFLTKWLPVIILIIVFSGISFFFNQKDYIIADIDTEYSRIFIKKGIDDKTKREMISLSTDPFSIQAAVFAEDFNDLVFDYTKFFKIIEVIKPNTKSALMIGGSVNTYPRDFLKNFKEANMDVIEIDPSMIEIAKKYFGFIDDLRMNIIHEDGRIFLNNNKIKYDVIFGDAFNSISIPFQLTTIESTKKIFNSLEDDGVVVVNIVAAIEGDSGRFFRAEYATYKSVFPNVYVFALNSSSHGDIIQNIILIATKEEFPLVFSGENMNPLLSEYAKKLWTDPIVADVPILTDDFAPVESYQRVSM